MGDKPDFSIESYTIDDLLSILGITSPVTKQGIMDKAASLIEQYKANSKPQFVEFFSKAMNKLISSYTEVEAILSKGKDIMSELGPEDPTEPGENMMKNEYYMDGGLAGRAAEQLPDRRENISIVEDNHGTQGQRRLFVPNAYTGLPFLQGNMNPTMRNYHLTWVNVDSHYRDIRDSTNSSSCTFGDSDTTIKQMDNSTDFTFLLSDPLTNVMSLTVHSIELLLAGYYAFTERYGTTSFEIQYDGSNSCIRIPDGNYTAASLMDVINALLGAGGYPVSVFINPATQRTAVAVKDGETPSTAAITWYSDGCDRICDPSQCFEDNAGKKIDSSLGWSLGFRQPVYDLTGQVCEPTVDAMLNDWAKGDPTLIDGCWTGIESEHVFNQFGTRYMILEVDDFNKNRNSGNMATLTSNREKFKLPDYYKKSEASFPACAEPCSSLGYRPGKRGSHAIPRSCRKGTPNPNPIIDGSNNLTQAQKYTAAQMLNAQRTQSQQRYFAPATSNVIFRFPIPRLSGDIQAPIVILNESGLENARTYFGPTTIKRLKVRLLDDKGHSVDLRSDFSFSLVAQRLYQY